MPRTTENRTSRAGYLSSRESLRRPPTRLRLYWLAMFLARLGLVCISVTLIAGRVLAGQVSQSSSGAEPAPIKRSVPPPPGPYAPGVDAVHYDVALDLPASGKIIRGRTTATVRLRAPRVATFALDLTGLVVDRVQVKGVAIKYEYSDGKLRIPIPVAARIGDTLQVEVMYHGEPDDGLTIQSNVHGERTIFADNWPNRARFWFPSIDHPSDKATVSFTISAPRNLTVLANGASVAAEPAGSRDLSNEDEQPVVSRWRIARPIPTYSMVIGAARLTTGKPARACAASKCVMVSWWAFPQDAAKMEPSFRRAHSMLEYFASLIGPFDTKSLPMSSRPRSLREWRTPV